MAYSFRPSDPTPLDGVQRVAANQLRRAVDALCSPALNEDRKAYEARKRLKKVRALVRLIRPGFDGYQAVNRRLRNAGRVLAPLRDTGASIAAFDRLRLEYGEHLPIPLIVHLKEELVGTRIDICDDTAGAAMAKARRYITPILEDIGNWTIVPNDYETVLSGMRVAYRRGRDGLVLARSHEDDEALHEWRKKVKYHWLHVRLLKRLGPWGLDLREAQLGRLKDLLGDHQDITVFDRQLQQSQHPVTDEFWQIIIDRKAELRNAALSEGRVLFHERPAAFTARWRAAFRL